MTKKIFAPLAAVAFMALVAVSLVVSGGTASAAINGLSSNVTTVDPGGTVAITVDADEIATDVQLLATGGGFTACFQTDAATVCTVNNALGVAQRNTTVANADDTNTLYVTWTATAGTTTPQTVQITVIQGTSTKSLTIKVRGVADSVTTTILNGAPTSTTVCTGTEAHVLQSTTATQGLVNGTICSLVLDSGGARIPNQPVIYTTSDGSLSAANDTTGASGQRAAAVTIARGTSGASGDTAVVTASSSGKTTTDSVRFGGDPSSCEITTNPTTVSVGGAATVNVAMMDSTGGPVPDDDAAGTDSSANVVQVNAGQGANAAILNANPAISNGTANTTAIAAISGAIALGASSNVTGNSTSCTGTLIATGVVVPPVGGGGSGEFTGDIADAGVSLVVFGGGSVDELSDAADAAGAVSISLTVGGEFVVYIVGAPAFVNEAFVDAFAGGIAAGTPVILFVG